MVKPHTFFLLSAALCLALAVTAGCLGGSPVAEETRLRVEQKAETAKGLIQQKAEAGEDVSKVLATLEAAGGRFEQGDVTGGETLLDQALAQLQPRKNLQSSNSSNESTTDLYGNPQRVSVQGYDASKGIMEPFMTRDGKYLLFNNGGAAHNTDGKKGDPDLHYAQRVDDYSFRYMGEIKGANSRMVDGAPSLDQNNRLFFISPRAYKEKLSTIHSAIFKNGKATHVGLVNEGISPQKAGWLNMDAEISADGKALYYSVNHWNTNLNLPITSNLHVAQWVGGRYERQEDSDAIFRNVNTGELEYAPSLSADQLVLAFTRGQLHIKDGKLRGMTSRILLASRKSTREPFGQPQWIKAITGFVEGPTFTPDRKILYYHKREAGTFHLYGVSKVK